MIIVLISLIVLVKGIVKAEFFQAINDPRYSSMMTINDPSPAVSYFPTSIETKPIHYTRQSANVFPILIPHVSGIDQVLDLSPLETYWGSVNTNDIFSNIQEDTIDNSNNIFSGLNNTFPFTSSPIIISTPPKEQQPIFPPELPLDPYMTERACICPCLYAPVYGCDGKLYSNSCNAKCAGVDICN